MHSIAISGLVSALVLGAPSHAGEAIHSFIAPQSVSRESSPWNFSGSLYAPLMGLEGDIGVGGLVSSVDMSFDDILDQLDGGLSGVLEARHGRWSITGDFIWLKLSASAVPAANAYVGLTQEEIIGSLTVGYELFVSDNTTLDFLAGAAVTFIDADLDIFTPRLPVSSRSASGSQDWIDPYVGLRMRQRLSEQWSLWIRGDYGGFGISSDEYWQLVAGISYRMSDHTSIALGYRMIGVDYHQGGFTYDTEMAGPNLGLIFHF